MHVKWALAVGGRLGVGNDPRYNNSRCFDTFPFPDTNETQKACIRELAEQLDAHRKRQQAQHPGLTMTDMYNVLEKLRTLQPPGGSEPPGGLVLSAKEKQIHEQGLVSILKQLHDDLDEAVFAAYGWPPTLTDEEILERLVALNAARAAEEAQGHIRWLRPEYQAPNQAQGRQATLLVAEEEEEAPVLPTAKLTWPATMAEQATAVRTALTTLARPVTASEVAGMFDGRATPKRQEQIGQLLETLAALGQAGVESEGRYTAV